MNYQSLSICHYELTPSQKKSIELPFTYQNPIPSVKFMKRLKYPNLKSKILHKIPFKKRKKEKGGRGPACEPPPLVLKTLQTFYLLLPHTHENGSLNLFQISLPISQFSLSPFAAHRNPLFFFLGP